MASRHLEEFHQVVLNFGNFEEDSDLAFGIKFKIIENIDKKFFLLLSGVLLSHAKMTLCEGIW